MIPILGYIFLIIAMAGAVAMGSTLWWKRGNITAFSIITGGTVTLSFCCLMTSFIVSDFSVLTVTMNSHTAKPLIYKISGTWGNHEGSMLLWVLAIALFTLCFAGLSTMQAEMKRILLASQGWIITGFLAFILFTSNPFARLSPVPTNGMGLNPLLQDIGLAMHPPMLYAGYVGFSIAFSAAIALLLRPEENATLWATRLKPWVLISWAFLTLGIGLGSWWAYRELGWGGFWFWDPVENASLMPWLSGTALIHSLLILEKRDALKRWCILLSIITFSLSLVGTFLVRSGVLTSVHAFANDPSRGIFILTLLAIAIIISSSLFAIYAPRIKSAVNFNLLSREGTILINNVLLLTACATVVLGTLYPLLLEVTTGEAITVGAPYFNSTVNLIALPITFLAYIGTTLRWTTDRFHHLAKQSLLPLACTIIVTIWLWWMELQASVMAITAIALSVWLLAGTLWLLFQRLKKHIALSPKFTAMVIAHCGFALLVLGIAISCEWQEEKEDVLQLGKSITISNYTATLENVEIKPHDNYIARRGVFSLTQHSSSCSKPHCDEAKSEGLLVPETRYYPVENTQTTESAIYSTLFSNLYIALGDVDDTGNIAARIYYKPGINIIWAGSMLMALGGAYGLVTRRRIAA